LDDELLLGGGGLFDLGENNLSAELLILEHGVPFN
jgi:hypothetical protein